MDPFGKAGAGGEDESAYYRYAVARLAALSNVMWDVANEYHLLPTEAWVEQRGRLLQENFLLKMRREQEKTGRPMPQVNEELTRYTDTAWDRFVGIPAERHSFDDSLMKLQSAGFAAKW